MGLGSFWLPLARAHQILEWAGHSVRGRAARPPDAAPPAIVSGGAVCRPSIRLAAVGPVPLGGEAHPCAEIDHGLVAELAPGLVDSVPVVRAEELDTQPGQHRRVLTVCQGR